MDPGDRLVLGVDASSPRGSVALAGPAGVVAEIGIDGLVSPSRRLLPSVRFLLETTAQTLADLAGFAVTVGPGGFTGIRVGLATVRGLALAGGQPVAGVSTLAALADAAGRPGERLAAWLDAGRGEVYAGLFAVDATPTRPPAPWGPECVAAPATVLAGLPAGPLLFAGQGALRHADLIAARPAASGPSALLPRTPFLAGAAARLGALALAAGAAAPAEPCYLRPPDALQARSRG
ncbi:MAG: tRNA (adenosine(37)-N6)-threonylcarbamoyltransferase complex dimerization subunit type 1 TsaB [Acidobacteriota bacterium]